MALREVLCSLLLDGPAHGYQLQVTLEAELGPLWVTRASQVYLTLRSLSGSRSGGWCCPSGSPSWSR